MIPESCSCEYLNTGSLHIIMINSTTSQTSITYYLTNSILETGPLHTRYTPYKQPPQNAVFTVNLITRPRVEGGSTLTTSFTCSLVTLPQCSMMPGMWPIPTTPTTVGGVNPSPVSIRPLICRLHGGKLRNERSYRHR